MKKIYIFLVIGILTFQLNAQQSQANPDYLRRAKTKIKIGTTLTIAGAGTMVGGTVLLANGMGRKYPSTPGHITSDTYTSTGGVAGYALMTAGGILIGIGIPVLIVGGADGNDPDLRDRTLSSTGYPASKTKMLLAQHLTFFKPVAFASKLSTLMA